MLLNVPDEESREESKKTLLYFGYDINTEPGKIESALLKEKSKLELLDHVSQKNVKSEEINFYKLLTNVENALGRQLDVDKITLAHWIELVEYIKLKNAENGRRKRSNR